MSRKNLIRIGVISLIFLIFLIVFEVLARGTGFVTNKIEKTITDKRQIKKYENSEEYKEEQKLIKIVEDVSNLLKSSDIDALYNVTNKLFLDYKFENNRELFEEYMSRYIGEDFSIEFQTYVKRGNMYDCTVLSKKDGRTSTFPILIILEDENEEKYTLIFDSINSLKKVDVASVNKENNLKATLKYVATATNSLIFNVEIENTGNEETKYLYDEVTLTDTSSNIYKLKTIQGIHFNLRPGEKTRETYRFSAEELFLLPKNLLSISFSERK